MSNDDSSAMVLQYLILPAPENLELMFLSDEGVHALLSCVARSHSTIRSLDEFYSLIQLFMQSPQYQTLSCLEWSNDNEDSVFAAVISGGCLPALELLIGKDAGLGEPMNFPRWFRQDGGASNLKARQTSTQSRSTSWRTPIAKQITPMASRTHWR
ncbi:hypothetical protein GGX14DRAFT_553533 [Mycena pura]|uniref:Uncharacterized protein n=1 Tax=Mycena pura TaxID=153505 RepID=A0AAD6YUG1_9AGAR|nr:hypothetical protein GGX14DRAFT_553533 [Mycena pura]